MILPPRPRSYVAYDLLNLGVQHLDGLDHMMIAALSILFTVFAVTLHGRPLASVIRSRAGSPQARLTHGYKLVVINYAASDGPSKKGALFLARIFARISASK